MSQQTTEVAPVTKTVRVKRPPEEAFRLYTEGIGTWWPLDTHSPSEGRGETVVMEPRAGGRLYERTHDGEEVEWGEVLVWEPPQRVVHSWHLGQPIATEVELRFLPEAGGTRVELEHRGWERAPERRPGYVEGWDEVLGRYVEAAIGAGARSGT